MAKQLRRPAYRRPTDGGHVLERKVERALVDAAKAAGGVAHKWSSPNQAGVPDRLVLLPGATMAMVECKREGLRRKWDPMSDAPWSHPGLTRLQALELQRLAELGFQVEVVDTREGAWDLVERMAG